MSIVHMPQHKHKHLTLKMTRLRRAMDKHDMIAIDKRPMPGINKRPMLFLEDKSEL